TSLVFPDCLVITADSLIDPRLEETHLICKECKHPLEHKAKPEWLAKGIWVPEQAGASARGFKISQLYSMTVKPKALAESFIRAQSSAADEQEFYNSKLGEPHIVDSACISMEEVIRAIRSYKTSETVK